MTGLLACSLVASLAALSTQFAPPAPKAEQPSFIYVVSFTSPTIRDTPLLVSFTDLYEEALLASQRYRIHNRRTVQQILAEAESEAAIQSMNDLSPKSRHRLATIEKVDGLIFGEVVDDVASGEIVITATLQSFDSTTHWKRRAVMKRGLVMDLASRTVAMQELARSDDASRGARREASADPADHGAGGRSRVQDGPGSPVGVGVVSGIAFRLSTCRRAASAVICEFVVVAEHADLQLTIGGNATRAIDNLGREGRLAASNIGVARQGGDFTTAWLSAGVPLAAELTFVGIAAGATALTIEIQTWVVDKPGPSIVGVNPGETIRMRSIAIVEAARP
jgi:hypothetical protein